MPRSGRNHVPAVAALLTVLLLAGCGGEDEQDGISPSLRALALASEVTDLSSRLVPIAESVIEDPGKRNREDAASELAQLGEEAGALREKVAADVDDRIAEPLADASECYTGAFGTLADAVSSQRGVDAQAGAREARSELAGCFEDLEAATGEVRADARVEARALAARISAQANGIDGRLAGLVKALAAPVRDELAGGPDAESDAGEPGPTTIPREDLPPGEPGGFETADLPPCSDAPPPCRQGDSVVEP